MPFRVLIVDDQHEVSRLLRSALETIEQGLEVLEAPSGEEALLESARTKFDLLVADFRLPGISGVELMKKVRGRDPKAKVILITGVSDAKTKSEIANAGADAYFMKPVPMADFLDAVERLLGMERTIQPSDKEEKPDKRKTLADLLVNFRKELKADALLLLSDRGRVVAQAGELPDPNTQVSLTSALMAIYSAAQKVSLLVEHSSTSDLHLFHGEKLDLLFAPVGLVHVILISGKGLATGGSLEKTIKTLGKAQNDIENALKAMGVTGPLVAEIVEEREAAPAQPAVVESAEAAGDFEELLKQASQKNTPDVDAYWNQAAAKGTAFVLKDTLSFDEAKKLGLAPDAGK